MITSNITRASNFSCETNKKKTQCKAIFQQKIFKQMKKFSTSAQILWTPALMLG